MALLQAFAEQAVIAITSAERIVRCRPVRADLQELLEYHTATSQLLKLSAAHVRPATRAGYGGCDCRPVLQCRVWQRSCAPMAICGDWGLTAGFHPELEAYQRAVRCLST